MRIMLLKKNYSHYKNELINILNDLNKDNYLDGNNKTFILLNQNNKIIGWLDLRFVLDESEILYLYILEEHRHNGLGEKILSYSLDYLKKKHIKSVYLEVDNMNEYAIRLYKKIGFITVSIREKYYSNSHDAYVMKKEL